MSNLHLFKDSITLTDYDVLIQELTAAVEAGTSTLTAFCGAQRQLVR